MVRLDHRFVYLPRQELDAHFLLERRLVRANDRAWMCNVASRCEDFVVAVMAFVVARRSKELGIRLAFAARRSLIIWSVMREVLLLLTMVFHGGRVDSGASRQPDRPNPRIALRMRRAGIMSAS